MSSFGHFELWPLLTVAKSAARNYGHGVLSLDLSAVIAGVYQAGQGLSTSIYIGFHLLKTFLDATRAIASGRGWSMLGFIGKLTTNLGITLLAFISNGIILAGPPYLLWELFLAADPIVLPDILVFSFRTLLDFAITFGSIIFTILVIWFFVEEFTSGRNQVFELDDYHQDYSMNQSSDHQARQPDRGTMNADQVQSKLAEVERQLKNDQ